MNRINYIVERILWVLLICAFLVRPTYAYLDPGSGSFLLQILLASLVGALFVLRQFWRRFWAFFKRIGNRIINHEGNIVTEI